MKKLLYLLPLFAFTCNKGVPNSAPKILLDSTNTTIGGNNITYMKLLQQYTGFTFYTNKKYTIYIMHNVDSIGFSIKKDSNIIYINGDACMGVVFFLDKYLGIRFYMPGAEWTTPKKDSLLVDSLIDIVHKPFTPVVNSTGYLTFDESTWSDNNSISSGEFGYTQHTMSMLFYDSSMFKLFPDIYDKEFPVSSLDGNFEPDFTKPDMIHASLYAARKFFATYPQTKICFGVMDSWNGYPDPLPNETLQTTFFKFLNEFADSIAMYFPGKSVTYSMYGNFTAIPTMKLRSNITPIGVYQISNIIADKIDTNYLRRIANVSTNWANHDWAEGMGFLVPRIYSKLLQTFLQNIDHVGIKFQFAGLEVYPNWSLDGIRNYEMGRIYDDPYINIDSMRASVCYDLFGSGAISMKKYFDTIESLTTSMNSNYSFERKIFNYISQMPLNTSDSELVANARDYLSKALNITTGTEHARIQFFSNGFRISESLWSIYKKNADSTFIPFLKDSIAGNQMYLNIATDPDFMNTMTNLINSIK